MFKYTANAMIAIILLMSSLAMATGNGDEISPSETQTISFYGLAVELVEPESIVVAPTYWIVKTNKVLKGYPCNDTLKVIISQSLDPPWGYNDPQIKTNHLVSVYGEYLEDENGCFVTLHGSEHYYIKKLAEPIKFTANVVDFRQCTAFNTTVYWAVNETNILKGPEPSANLIKVVTYQVVSGPWGQADQYFSVLPGDLVEVYGTYFEDEYGCQVSLWGSEDYYFKRIVGCNNLNQTIMT